MRRRALILALLSLVAAAPALAQFDLVTGQVVDPNGLPYSNAQLRISLTLNGGAVTGQPTVTNSNQAQCISAGLGNAPCQMPFSGSTTIFLDAGGNIPSGGVILADNPSITPAGTQWTFSISISAGISLPIGTGPQSFSVPITINSNPQSVGATLTAAAPKLSNLSAGSLIGTGPSTPGTCTVGQVFFNTSTNQLLVCTSTNTFTTVGGTGSVTSFSYASTGLTPLVSSVVTNPTTTPLLTQTGSQVQPGTVLAGPIATGTSSNPTFENGFVSAVTGLTATVTGTPLAPNSVAIFFARNSIGQTGSAPSGGGTWTSFGSPVLNNNNLYYQNISSSATLTTSSTFATSEPTNATMVFLGGSITSIVQGVGSAACGQGCQSLALSSPVTASHTLLVYGYFSGSSKIPVDLTCRDTLGNVYSLIYIASDGGTEGVYAFIAQNVLGGSDTLTLNSSIIASNPFPAVVFELAGPNSFFTGANGPWSFRPLNAQDLLPAAVKTNQVFSATTLSSDVSVAASTQTTVATLSVTMPAIGCPCRAFINYSLYVNTGTSGVGYEFWVNDGTQNQAGVSTGQSNASSGALTSASYGGLSTVLYQNNQAVTFTLLTEGDHSYTVKAASPVALGSAPNSSFQISIQTSN